MVERWKTEFDHRQYASMENQLRQYEEGGIDLGPLIASLEALLQCLEAADEVWKNEFRRKWGILEEVNAVALDQVEQGVSLNVDTVLKEPANQRLINQAVESIRQLLASRPARVVSKE
jgi:hypothetical protein